MSSDPGGRLLYLSQAEVEASGVTMSQIVDALTDAFREKGEGRVEMPPKPGVHPGDGDNFIHAMPAYIPALGSAGVKWVSGYPENWRRGLPYITGLLVLNDVDTGIPTVVMDCVWLTAMRTAAASALSARYLARSDSKTLGILGCGVQGHSHVEALRVVLPSLDTVFAYDLDADRARRFASEIAEAFGVTAVAVDAPRGAVTGCDVVVTAGPILHRPHGTIKAGWLDAGAFLSAVDFDSYLDPGALAEFDRFTTDDVPQFRYYQDRGYFQHIPRIDADLGELVTGQRAGRLDHSERTIAVNLGLALEDMAVAPLIAEQARRNGLGTWLPL